MRSPAWSRDELILALNLYSHHHPNNHSAKSKEVVELSEFLRSLSPELASSIESYRSPNSVYMKLCNFLRFDPSYNGKGLPAGAVMEEAIWVEFYGKPELALAAAAIRNSKY